MLSAQAVVASPGPGVGFHAAALSAAQPSSPPPTRALVHLITGEVIAVNTPAAEAGGRSSADIVSKPSYDRAILTSVRGGDEFVVPSAARSFIGSLIDPGLFDASAIARHPTDELTVRLRVAAGVRDVHLPGARVQRVDATTATASFTRASTAVFGAALVAATRARVSSTSPAGSPFAGVLRISPMWAAPPAAPTAVKRYTLTVQAKDWLGHPDNEGVADVFNLDHLNGDAPFIEFENGVATIKLAAGRYDINSFFYDAARSRWYIVPIPQLRVDADKTIVVDARTATAKVSVTTPKPVTREILDFGLGRIDDQGSSVEDGAEIDGAGQLYVEPIDSPPTFGRFETYAAERAASPSGVEPAYTYDVLFPRSGTIATSLHFVVDPSRLASVPSTYLAERRGQTSQDVRFHFLPWEFGQVDTDVEFAVPKVRTEYYSARADTEWGAVDSTVSPDQDSIAMEDQFYRPGHQPPVTWGGQPRHPRLLQGALFAICAVCESSTDLDTFVNPFGDNTPTHSGFPDQDTTGINESLPWSISADSQRIANGNGSLVAEATLVDGTTTYAIAYRNERTGAQFPLSTDSRTTWTVPADAALGPLPAHWYCTDHGGTDCSVVPVLTSTYRLPLDDLGRIQAGDVDATVTIGHLGGASHAAIRPLTAQVSFDDGTHWSDAVVTARGKGVFGVAFTVPPRGQTNGYGALRIQAADADGRTLVESIVRAFAVHP